MTASQASAVCVGSAIAPEIACVMDVRSAFASRAPAASRSNIGGTPGKNVAGRRRCAARTASTSNFGKMTTVAAISTEYVRHSVIPKAWKNGSAA